MGLFDVRCMITGVSLRKCPRTKLVPLVPKGLSYYPTALAITGTYDRLGCIDHVREDANTRLVLRYFRDKLGSGEFVIDEKSYKIDHRYPITTTERLLYGFERNMNNSGRTALLHGQPVVFGLIWARAWDAAAQVGRPGLNPPRRRFGFTFRDVPAAEEMYDGALKKIDRPLRELAAVGDFLEQRRLGWWATRGDGQHFSEEMHAFLTQARRSFADCPPMYRALERYAREVAEPSHGVETARPTSPRSTGL